MYADLCAKFKEEKRLPVVSIYQYEFADTFLSDSERLIYARFVIYRLEDRSRRWEKRRLSLERYRCSNNL